MITIRLCGRKRGGGGIIVVGHKLEPNNGLGRINLFIQPKYIGKKKRPNRIVIILYIKIKIKSTI